MTVTLAVVMSGLESFIREIVVKSYAESGSDATKIIDTDLAIYGNGKFDGWWLFITSGSAQDDIRQVESFVNSTGTLTPYDGFSATIASGTAYEIHKYNPSDLKDAINNAILSIYPALYRRIVFKSLGQSLLTSDASSGQKDVIVADSSLFFEGQEVYLIDEDEVTEDCTIASIDSSAETLTMEDNLGNTFTTAKTSRVYAKDGHYFNTGATLEDAEITGIFLTDSENGSRNHYTKFEEVFDENGVRKLHFPSSFAIDEQTVEIEAICRLEVLDEADDELTLEEKRLSLLYCEAAYHLYEAMANDISSADYGRLKALAASYGPFTSGQANKANAVYRHWKMGRPRFIADLTIDSDSD